MSISSIKSKTGAALPRRTVIKYGLGMLALSGVLGRVAAGSLSGPNQSAEVTIDLFLPSGKIDKTVRLPKLVKTDAVWRQQLSEIAYQVARKAGTERPYTGKDWNNHKDGLYRCICCGTAVFDSKTKFESGTGWPSFWQPISATNIITDADSSFGMTRTAIACRLCDAHLGHVFDDGPKPTGLRYCMNSASMRFVARA
ncbi:MAG: peptide-methionine (R)-S-oxide reductase MsrB [Collimonas sp.]|uniref:peptide-methionine (R)-S-oxide reductase MsrB n=1 Tax=Collimonas sp. TaxID=1963772 RepID=UPI0032664D2B